MADATEDRQNLDIDQSLADGPEHPDIDGMRIADPDGEGDCDELPAFFGSFASGSPDLAERVDEIVRDELGGQ